MKTRVYKMKIIKYEITDSTNTRAKEYAKGENAVMPTLFIADGQTAGRGRRGRSFDSASGVGLYMSILFRPEPNCCDAAKITVRAAVSVARALRALTGISVGIKWVNDIYFDGKKLAGILTEGELDGDGAFRYAVCGIGVNLLSRSFPEEISGRAVALGDVSDTVPDKDLLAERICSEFFAAVDYADIIKEYRSLSVVIGRRAEMRRISGESFFASVLDVTDSGSLLVLRDDGVREELISAEVSVVF